MRFKAYTGVKEKTTETSFKLMPLAAQPGLIVAGGEDETKYEFWAKVKIVDAERASLICSFQEDEDYNKSYMEFCLDLANQELALYLIIESEAAAPVKALARKWKIDQKKEYMCGMRLNQDSEGDYYVLCYIDDLEVFRLYYLGPLLQKGMWGFKVEGPDAKYAEYNGIFPGPFGCRDFADDILRRVHFSTEQISYEDLWQLVDDALITIGNELSKTLDFPTLTDDEQLLLKNLTDIYAICKVSGGSAAGLNFTLGSLSVSTTAIAAAVSNFSVLEAEVHRILHALKSEIAFVIGESS